jgi:hypothetical protein
MCIMKLNKVLFYNFIFKNSFERNAECISILDNLNAL